MTLHSWMPWQWLIYLSCPWHMPQLESHFLKMSLFGFLAAIFPVFRRGWAATMLTLGTLSLPPGAIWSQNIPSRFLGDCRRKIQGKGYILDQCDGPFCWMKPDMELLSLGTTENSHQSCGPEQRGFIIVCGSRSAALEVMRNQMELQGKLRKAGVNV